MLKKKQPQQHFDQKDFFFAVLPFRWASGYIISQMTMLTALNGQSVPVTFFVSARCLVQDLHMALKKCSDIRDQQLS